MINTTSFQIFYDAKGTELAQHRIDTKTLSISISSMANSISTVDGRLNDGRQTVKLVVTNPIETGSLGVPYTMTESAPHTINVAEVIGLAGLADAVIGTLALSLIRQLGSKKVIFVTKRVGTDQSVFELESEEIICYDSVAKLVTDSEIRDTLVNVVRVPLNGKEGAVSKILNEDGAEVIRLESEETEEIKLLPRGTLLGKKESVGEVNVRFIRIDFGGTRGWRIGYLGEGHAASFEDQLFIY